MTLWAIQFRGHIHTARDGRLAVFHRRRDAIAWMHDNGGSDCKIVKFVKT